MVPSTPGQVGRRGGMDITLSYVYAEKTSRQGQPGDSMKPCLVRARRYGPYVAMIMLHFSIPAWGAESIGPERLGTLSSGARSTIVDVRSPSEFAKEHIEGAINVPLSQIADSKLPTLGPLVLYCTGEGCPVSKEAARVLEQKGYTNVEVLEGGLLAWEAKGYPTVVSKTEGPKQPSIVARVSPRALRRDIRSKSQQVVDVRPANEFASAHIPSAASMPLESLDPKSTPLDLSRPVVVYDRLPARSQEAATRLKEAGFNVSELSGGLSVWVAMKFPLEVSAK